MIAGQRVFVERALCDGRRRHDSRHVDVRQSVGEVVDVDVDPVSGDLTLDPVVARPKISRRFDHSINSCS